MKINFKKLGRTNSKHIPSKQMKTKNTTKEISINVQ